MILYDISLLCCVPCFWYCTCAAAARSPHFVLCHSIATVQLPLGQCIYVYIENLVRRWPRPAAVITKPLDELVRSLFPNVTKTSESCSRFVPFPVQPFSSLPSPQPMTPTTISTTANTYGPPKISATFSTIVNSIFFHNPYVNWTIVE